MPRKRQRAKARRPDMTQEERDALMLAHAKEHYTPADVAMTDAEWIAKYGEVAGIAADTDQFDAALAKGRWCRATFPIRRQFMPTWKDRDKPARYDAYAGTETR